MRDARQMGIRCSGRGSAANSLVAYLLGITGVDPLAHGLLFERFLTPERRGIPDIDVDVQSDRRDELIRHVERTYTRAHAAMVANVVTYRPRLALRDAAKALGFPPPLADRLTKVLPHHTDPADVAGYRDELAAALRDAAWVEGGTTDGGGEDGGGADARTLARCSRLRHSHRPRPTRESAPFIGWMWRRASTREPPVARSLRHQAALRTVARHGAAERSVRRD